MHKDWYSLDEVPYCFLRSSIKFLGHMGWKISDLNQVWVRLLGWSQLSNPSDLPYLFSCKMIKQNQLENHLVLLCHSCEAPFLLVKHTVTWISWNWHSYIVVDFIGGHWIQEIAKFNIHVKPLIKAVLIIQSLWFCFLSITDVLLSLVPNHEWYDIFQKLYFLLISTRKINHFELVGLKHKEKIGYSNDQKHF